MLSQQMRLTQAEGEHDWSRIGGRSSLSDVTENEASRSMYESILILRRGNYCGMVDEDDGGLLASVF